MARIFVTGSADGLGKSAASALLDEGHRVVVHVRSRDRLAAVESLAARGADAVVGDLADREQTRGVAEQVDALGPMDAVIHNAGIYSDAGVLAVNVTAPYLLTALMRRPKRLIYLSSGMHRGGSPRLEGLDWTGRRSGCSYSDTKLFITAFSCALARRWPDLLCNAVDPGWVPTRMGGKGAPDDLRLGHVTQVWLATSDDAEARTTGGYWFHQRRSPPHPAAEDEAFQQRLIDALAGATGVTLD